MVGIPITAPNFSRTAKLPPTSWLNTTILGLTSYATFFVSLNCVRGDDISNFWYSQRSQVKASFDANPALWSDPSHTEMYSPVSPQVGHETSVSKQVNWNTWAIIQDCSIPSATRSAAPIISIFFREAPTTFGSHGASLQSFNLTCFSAFAVRHKSIVSWVRLFCFRGISGIDGNTQFQEKCVNLGNICRNTSWIDRERLICWQIINKTKIKRSALWEGRVQPSVAGVLVLISDWSISKSNDVMLVTTPNKEISIENQGSETAGNLFTVGLGDYDVELGTKKRGRPLQRYQTWPTFRSTWGCCQGSNNVLFSQNKFKTTRQILTSTLYWHNWRH